MKRLSVGARRAVIAAVCVVLVFGLFLVAANVPAVAAGIETVVEALRFPKPLRVDGEDVEGLSPEEERMLQYASDSFESHAGVPPEIVNYDAPDPEGGLGMVTAIGPENKEKTVDHDEEGNRVETNFVDNRVQSIYRFVAHSGELMDVEEYDAEGNLMKTTVFTYDEEGTRAEMTFAVDATRAVFRFDPTGKLTLVEAYDAEGNLTQSMVFE